MENFASKVRARMSEQKKDKYLIPINETKKIQKNNFIQGSIEKVHVDSTNNLFAAATVVRGRGLVVGCYGLKQNL